MPCDHCPIGDGCKSYPTLCENLAKNPRRWLPVVARVNEPPRESPRSARDYPSIATQAVGVLGAAARFTASGFARVDQAEYDRRRSICEGCEHFDAAKDKCRACGCRLSVKPWMRSESCPKDAW